MYIEQKKLLNSLQITNIMNYMCLAIKDKKNILIWIKKLILKNYIKMALALPSFPRYNENEYIIDDKRKIIVNQKSLTPF